MLTAILVIQGILASAFALAGIMKIFVPIKTLQEKMAWTNRFAPSTVRLIGYSELFASIGLFLPMLMEVGKFMVPVAACGLAVIQVLAIFDHASNNEKKEIIINVLLLLMALFVMAGSLFF